MLQDWQVRVIHERADLYIKLTKLQVYLSGQIPKPQLLVDQVLIMHEYLIVLDKRIKEFSK